jgi:hypothetical protein
MRSECEVELGRARRRLRSSKSSIARRSGLRPYSTNPHSAGARERFLGPVSDWRNGIQPLHLWEAREV